MGQLLIYVCVFFSKIKIKYIVEVRRRGDVRSSEWRMKYCIFTITLYFYDFEVVVLVFAPRRPGSKWTWRVKLIFFWRGICIDDARASSSSIHGAKTWQSSSLKIPFLRAKRNFGDKKIPVNTSCTSTSMWKTEEKREKVNYGQTETGGKSSGKSMISAVIEKKKDRL